MSFLLFLIIFFTTKENLIDVYFTKGMLLYEKGDCQSSIIEFDNYISSGGQLSKIIRPLAFCEVEMNQLETAIDHLEQIFASDNNDNDVVELLFRLYISKQNFQKAKPLVPIIVNLADKKNELFLLISALYFNTKEYEYVLKYLKDYKVDSSNFEIYKNYLLIDSISNYNLKNYKEAKSSFVILDKILPENDIEKKDIKNLISQIEIYQKNRNRVAWINLQFETAAVFDSNITSQPPISEHFQSDLPGMENIENSDITAMGFRNESWISFDFYPIYTQTHQIITNISTFSAIHYPEDLDGFFDPQKYDTLIPSFMLGYLFQKKLPHNQGFKIGTYFWSDLVVTEVIEDPYLLNYNFNGLLYLSFSQSKKMFTELHLFLRDEIYRVDYMDSSIENQDRVFFRPTLKQIFYVNQIGLLEIGSSYLLSYAKGDMYDYQGLDVNLSLEIKFLSFLKLKGGFYFEKKWYSNYISIDGDSINRDDREFHLEFDITSFFTDSIGISIFYHYFDNDSSISEYDYSKHLAGIKFISIF
ncbi:hypothetical protein JXR93_02690 [bacterium]|nr:hypothetical protein [bacterium]